jgi:phage gpG-like protein
MRLSIDVIGMDAVSKTMTTLTKANKNYRVPLTLAGFRMQRSVAENFKAQGIREIGIKWPKLSQFTIKMRKMRRGRKGGRTNKALLDRGTLMNSYTSLGSGSIWQIMGNNTLIFGSNLPYARKQQEGFTNPGGVVDVAKSTRRKTAKKRRSKKNRVSVKAHTRKVKPTRVPARAHLTIKPKKDVRIINKIFLEYETRAMMAGGAQ